MFSMAMQGSGGFGRGRKIPGAAAASARKSLHRENSDHSHRWLVRDDTRRRHEQPEVDPQVVHFMHVPLRTRVKLPQSPQASPS